MLDLKITDGISTKILNKFVEKMLLKKMGIEARISIKGFSISEKDGEIIFDVNGSAAMAQDSLGTFLLKK